MRITRIQLAGLAVALAGGAVHEAAAADLEISGAAPNPVVTSNANGGPGNITIVPGGSITIDAGETAVTADSSHNVSNGGAISSNNASNTTGILITNGFTGDITNSGTILLVEDNAFEDDDDDGDLDGDWAIGTNRHGIRQVGNHTGNILNSGGITVEAIGATGISIDGTLTGNLSNTGDIAVSGNDSVGILIQGAGVGVTGDVITRRTINARGEDAVAILVDSSIGGELSINGTVTASGFPSTFAPQDQSDLDAADDLLIGGAAIHVRDSIARGIVIEGIGVEDDDDDDDDGTDNESDDNFSAQVLTYGSAPAVLVQANGVNIVLGDTDFDGTFGFFNRGNLISDGIFDNIDATAFRLEGIGGSTVDTTGGIANDFLIQANSHEANAYAISIGDGVTAPLIRNRGSILGLALSEGADTAYGIYIEGGSVSALNNSGVIRTQMSGELGHATAIFDATGTLTNITNSGSIIAELVPTDDDPTDGVVPPTTGVATAIHLGAATNDILIQQIADSVFPDDDGNDDDVDSRPDVSIVGNIILGSGSDTFNLLAGTVVGDLEFGGGLDDNFRIDFGASFTGALSDSNGILDITVTDGLLDIRGGDVNGEVNITSAYFDANSDLRVQVSDTATESTLIQASGTVTFINGATVRPTLPVGLPDNASVVFLTAGSLVGGALVEQENITGEGVPFLYDVAIRRTNQAAADGAANGLRAVYEMKDAVELGLSTNQSAAFGSIIDALQLDTAAAAAFTSLDNQSAFADAYEDLMPSFSSAAAELAATAIQQAQGASGNRLAATRLQGIDEVSIWAQEIGYAVTRTPPTLNGQEFSGHGFGIAVGIDGPLDNGALFGLSASMITSEVEEEGRPDGEISATFGQVGAYLGAAMGPVDLDFVAGLGAGQMTSQRVVRIGDEFEAQADAEWWAYEGHGMVRASAPLALGNSFVITPQAALTYVFLSEDGYTEEGGGAAIDYEVDSVTSQRLWADAGVEFSTRMRLRGETVIAPRLFVGYRANIIDEEAERSFRFVSGGDDFTLTDEGFGDGGALVGIGIDATNGYSTFALGYEGEFGDQIERHSLNASIRFRF